MDHNEPNEHLLNAQKNSVKEITKKFLASRYSCWATTSSYYFRCDFIDS